MTIPASVDRQTLPVDLAVVGFGPASGGFLTTLSRAIGGEDGGALIESRAAPGLPLQVVCYERAADLAFGVSGVVSRARGIRESFPDLDLGEVPMATPVGEEKVVWLFDPVGASKRSKGLRAAESMLRVASRFLPRGPEAVELPLVPAFLRKEGGLVFGLGQFNQWVAGRLMISGAVQVWPGMPVTEPLFEGDRLTGVRLADQGVGRTGEPDAGFLPGMDIRADLTVVADGPVGPVGRELDRKLGLPDGHHQRDWAVGMKFVVDLPESCPLETGTVLHTIGFPEPEIFGFLYVHPGRVASLGIFVPSWLDSPVRTAYRYLQHWMQHPYLWRWLEGGTLRSWGAKTLAESGQRGEPRLVGEGWARIGEGSGTTNVLTGSGVDEAWTSGAQLADGVAELLRAGEPLDRANLEKAYVARRRASRLQCEGDVARRSRDGFQRGFLTGIAGMMVAGLTHGKYRLGRDPARPADRVPSLEEALAGRIPAAEVLRLRREAAAAGTSRHDAIMDRLGWPPIEPDGRLIVSHQDALLLGGKVQAPAGYADHVVFVHPHLCEKCDDKLCIEMCSGQAIRPGANDGVPDFDREKCVHCGACVWNCTQARDDDPERGNVEFRAGAGGFHSVEN